MGLDMLLARLEAQSVTSAADTDASNVTEKTKEIKACTAVTAVTPKNNTVILNQPLSPMPARGTADWDDFEERAAIMQFDGGLDLHQAEICARHQLSQLQDQEPTS